MRSPLLTFLALASAAAVAAPAAQAAPDPERNATTQTVWSWALGRTEDQINDIRQTGMRLTDIEVESASPYKFAGVFVKNTGVYGRAGGWWYGKSADQVVALTKNANRRIIDLETYTVGGKRRFAIVTVKNTGPAEKSWWWNYDLTPDQVTHDINEHGIRLVDLNVYRVNGQTRYSYVGIKNSGEDKKAWWWYYNVTPSFVQAKAKENGARVIDVERPSAGKLTVVMVKGSEFSLVNTGTTAEKLGQMTASQGSRITDLEKVGNGYAAVTLDDVSGETARLRGLLRASPYKGGYFGAYSKVVGGPSIVNLAQDSPYQPMSVMKLVPFLYAINNFDSAPVTNPDYLNATKISWSRANMDDGCAAASGNTTFTDTLYNVLFRAMRESLNRAHESLLETYTPEAITSWVNGAPANLSHTQMYYGCPHPGKQLWTSSRTTLVDMGQLFEDVELKKVFPKQWQASRDKFYEILATWPTDWFRTVVTEEATKLGKQAKVDEFLSKLEIKGKGGGVDNGTSDGQTLSSRAFSYRILIPFRGADGNLTMRPFVGGFFVNDITGPCSEDDYYAGRNTSAACATWAKSLTKTFGDMAAEVQRVPIREALKAY